MENNYLKHTQECFGVVLDSKLSTHKTKSKILRPLLFNLEGLRLWQGEDKDYGNACGSQCIKTKRFKTLNAN